MKMPRLSAVKTRRAAIAVAACAVICAGGVGATARATVPAPYAPQIAGPSPSGSPAPVPTYTDIRLSETPTNTQQTVAIGDALMPMQLEEGYVGPTVTFTVVSGALPDGVALNPDGTFTGATTKQGTYAVTLRAANGLPPTGGEYDKNSTEWTFHVYVGPPGTGTPPMFGPEKTNVTQNVYTGQKLTPLTASGIGALHFAAADPAPDGVLLLDNGTWNGTPTKPGTWVMVIALKSDGSDVVPLDKLTITVTAAPAPQFSASGQNTHQSVAVRAGLSPLEVTDTSGTALTWSVTKGSLPPGIALLPTGGFKGVATTAGSTTAAITVTNEFGASGSTDLVVDVSASAGVHTVTFGLQPENTTQHVQVGQGLAPLHATDALGGPVTFKVVAGKLPNGVSLAPNGTFTGTTTTQGTISVDVQAVAVDGYTASTSLQVTVTAPPAAPAPQPPAPVKTIGPASSAGGAAPTASGSAVPNAGASVSPSGGPLAVPSLAAPKVKGPASSQSGDTSSTTSPAMRSAASVMPWVYGGVALIGLSGLGSLLVWRRRRRR